MPPQGGRKHPHQELIHIDTSNILFICGGAFDGLEKIIETRMDKKAIGFNAEVVSKSSRDVADVLKEVTAQDLVKYGLIPEFVGRVPISISLDGLDEDALVKILTEPKNALVKQYQALLDMDEVELKFEEDAVKEIARLAMERKTGARGLRAIIEKAMLETMYNIPSDDTIASVTITKACVNGKEEPLIERRGDKVPEKKKEKVQPISLEKPLKEAK